MLLSLSHEPNAAATNDGALETALSLLSSAFPDFRSAIAGRDVLDFGCGAGLQSAAMGLHGARHVLGLDTNSVTLNRARVLVSDLRLGNVEFEESLEDTHHQQFDVVISQNSMEHFSDPAAILEQMTSVLKPGGKLFITFGPPWLSPYGSHMSFFTRIPWVNLLFSEATVMSVRARFISDGARRYEEAEGGLNKMTVRKFEHIVQSCGLRLAYRRYQCIKRLDFLGKLPIARELFVNHISCTLQAL